MEEVLARYFAGEATKKEKDEVESWRNASDENAREFFEYKTLWASTAVDTEASQAILSAILDESKPEMVPLWRVSFLKVAAMIVLAMGVLFTVYKLNQPDAALVSDYYTIQVLPDGSEVTLHEGATLKVGEFSDTKREVTLTGKAFFEIERDEDRPFTVRADDALITVLGTSFVVNAPGDLEDVEVLVNSGKVEFGNNPENYGDRAMAIYLEKGEMGMIKRGEKGIKKMKIEDANYLAWKTMILQFEKTTLQDVAHTLQDVYGLKIEFSNPAISQCRLTAKIKEKSAEEVLSIVAQTFNLTYDQKGKKVTFDGEGCN